MTLKCTVLDDYQNAALRMADWSPIAGRVEVRVLREHIQDPDELVAAIGDCELGWPCYFFFNLRQPPARLLAMICLNMAVMAGVLIFSPL